MTQTDYTIIYFLARDWLRTEPETGAVFYDAHRLRHTEPKWRPLKETKRGYLVYRPQHCGKVWNLYAHRIVWIAAMGVPEERTGYPEGVTYTVDHVDGDRQNNRLSNLQVVTNRANTQKGKCASLDPRKVLRIRQRRRDKGHTLQQIAKAFGVSKSTVHAVLSGQTWANVGGPLDESLKSYVPREDAITADHPNSGIKPVQAPSTTPIPGSKAFFDRKRP